MIVCMLCVLDLHADVYIGSAVILFLTKSIYNNIHYTVYSIQYIQYTLYTYN